jgi:hypothetical protein
MEDIITQARKVYTEIERLNKALKEKGLAIDIVFRPEIFPNYMDDQPLSEENIKTLEKVWRDLHLIFSGKL